jgi:Zn-dependent protease/CBS domain-containing protein
MKWSLKIGTFAGIGVFLHWTFALLIGWVLMIYRVGGGTWREALGGVAFVMALFVCIVLHEFGHALTARRYGVKTRDITLLPIGGVARLESMPEKPMQEFWVAIAGPLVNVAIAALLFLVLLAVGRADQLLNVEWMEGGRFLVQLMWANVFIVAFNMLPAFPMDGGRVLRSLLAMRMGRRRATAIASNIGQVMAILFGIVGFFIFHNIFLIFIAIMVYLGAQAEATQVEMQSALNGLRVRDAMMTRFRTLAASDTLTKAVEELLAGSQHDFPVLANGDFVGVLRREDLVRALSDGNRDAAIGDVMSRECDPVNESDDLTPTLEIMTRRQCSIAPVMGGGRIVGLLTMENIGELVMVSSSLERPPPPLTTDGPVR